VAKSGVCARCGGVCNGDCEVFRATFRGREVIDPGVRADSSVDVSTTYGWDSKTRMAAPVLIGALSSTKIDRQTWESFAVGAAISGVSLVVGADVCALDPALALKPDGTVQASPDMDRCMAAYHRHHDGLGELLVQVSAEDESLGVAKYVLDKHGPQTIELKWGSSTARTAAETKTESLQRALDWKQCGHVVIPNPRDAHVQRCFNQRLFTHFERHNPPRFVDEEGFGEQCQRLRRLGFERITLSTAACDLRELAMALKWASRARIDLVTIDGASSPEAPIAPSYLHAAATQFAARLAAKGERAPDLAFAGGFRREDQIFKALSLGAPWCKAVGVGRAMLVPGTIGTNVAHWMGNGGLPPSVSRYGEKLEEIFACWQQVAEIVGLEEMVRIPLGAVGIFSYVQKLTAGLQQMVAAGHVASAPGSDCQHALSLSREYGNASDVMDGQRVDAEAILDG
jgi:hypothetical protein